MKFPVFLPLVLLSFVLGGCGVVETIFKAGMWWAFILVALFVGVILWIISKTRKK